MYIFDDIHLEWHPDISFICVMLHAFNMYDDVLTDVAVLVAFTSIFFQFSKLYILLLQHENYLISKFQRKVLFFSQHLQVASRRVMQAVGGIFILMSFIQILSSFFATLPDPVIGGTLLAKTGNMQFHYKRNINTAKILINLFL